MRRGQKGSIQVIFAVIVVLAAVTYFTAIEMYLAARTRQYAKIKKAYQTNFLLEDMGKILLTSLENYWRAGGNCDNIANSVEGTITLGLDAGGNPIQLTGCWPRDPNNPTLPNFCHPNTQGGPACLASSDKLMATPGHEKSMVAELLNFLFPSMEASADPPGAQLTLSVPQCTPEGSSPAGDLRCQTCIPGEKNCPIVKTCVTEGSGNQLCFQQVVWIRPELTRENTPDGCGSCGSGGNQPGGGGEQGYQGYQGGGYPEDPRDE